MDNIFIMKNLKYNFYLGLLDPAYHLTAGNIAERVSVSVAEAVFIYRRNLHLSNGYVILTTTYAAPESMKRLSAM